jgi:hypothetical protein
LPDHAGVNPVKRRYIRRALIALRLSALAVLA